MRSFSYLCCAELNKWLTFRFLAIREKKYSKEISDLKNSLNSYSADNEYLIDLYIRWFDNMSDEPMKRNPNIEELVSQAYEYIFINDSGNRLFAMIMQLPYEKRHLVLGR